MTQKTIFLSYNLAFSQGNLDVLQWSKYGKYVKTSNNVLSGTLEVR